MEYREIVAVTGLGGLYQLLSTKNDGAIVKNLADKTTKFISARVHNVTPLESIEIYTTTDNVRLHEVLQKMKDNESKTPLADPKADNNTIKSYFKSVFPDFDDERVYVSDMKKMLKWYLILKDNDLLKFDLKQEPEAAAHLATPETVTEPEPEEKPAKKARAKKSADEDAAADGEAKPKKTARKKKSADEGAEGGDEPKKVAKKKSVDK